MADVEALYKSYGVLADAGDSAGEHSADYEVIIEGTKGSSNAKRLSADFIAKFYAKFPALADRAVEAQLDLCEDEDPKVRLAAIKALPMLCRDGDNSQIGDVLAQLLQSDSAAEAKMVRNALLVMLKKDTRSCLAGLFYQINSGEDLAREKSVSYLGSVVVDLLAEVAHPHPEIEAYILEEGKNALNVLLGADFSSIMLLLRKLKCSTNTAGIQQLAEILTEVGGFSKEDPPTEGDALLRALACAYEASFLCKRGAAPKVFVEFLVNTVLPSFAALPADAQLSAAKALASLSHPLAMKPEDIAALCAPTLQCLMALLPEAPAASESEDAPALPEVNYQTVECVLYAFHQFAKKNSEFMHSDEEAATRLRLLKVRLQFLGLCCQSASKALKASKEESAAVTVKAIQNISLLIKSFLKVPPVYQTTFSLSFAKPVVPVPAMISGGLSTAAEATGAQKRPAAPITAPTSAEMPKRPMTGKEMREQYAVQRASQPQQARTTTSPRGNGGGYYRNRGGQGRGGSRGRGGWRNQY